MTTKLSDLRMPCEHGKWGPHYFEMRAPLAVHRERCEGRGPLAEVSDLVEALQAEGVGEVRQWHGPITIQPKGRPEIGDDLPPGRYLVVPLGEDA